MNSSPNSDSAANQGEPFNVQNTPEIPPIPALMLDPRPVLTIGTGGWVVAAIILAISDTSARSVQLALAGVAVGAAGWLVYLLQRRAVQRGAKDAQSGIAL